MAGICSHQWVQTMPLENLRPLTDKNTIFGLLNDVEQWTLLDPVYKAYTKDLCGYAERGEKGMETPVRQLLC